MTMPNLELPSVFLVHPQDVDPAWRGRGENVVDINPDTRITYHITTGGLVYKVLQD